MALSVTPTDEMKTLAVGQKIYEVVDDQAREDISEVKADLLQKANQDGAYSDLTAGNAEQLVSTVYEEDSVPYIFRTAGGSMDIGDREEDMLVGGSIAWNQLLRVSDRTDSRNGVTFTSEDGIVTVVGTATANATFSVGDIPLKGGWVYLLRGCPQGGGNTTYLLYANYTTPQLLDSGNGSLKKQNTDTTGSFYIIVYAGTTVNLTFIPQLFNLTKTFGSTIADYIYSLEQANAGAGVAWFRKLFPNMDAEYSYHEDSFDEESPLITKKLRDYQPGILLSVEGVSAHATTGFNQWDKVTESGRIDVTTGENVADSSYVRSANYGRCIANTSYYCYAPQNPGSLAMVFYDANKTYIGYLATASVRNTVFNTPDGACYFRFYVSANAYANICINLHWDGERDGEYEPYVKRSYPLDSSLTLRGIPKLDSANNLYYDGDTYESDGTVTRRYGVVDLGTLNWVYQSERFRAPLNNAVEPAATKAPNAITAKYQFYPANVNFGNLDKGAAIISGGGNNLLIRDVSYTDSATFKTAMSGVYLVYELATPTTETADPYQNPQIVDDFGTEEYVTTGIVPVGHVTKYQPNLRAKLEMSPDSPDGDGDYIVRQANGENSYITLASTATIQDILARLTALEGNTNEG